jgi:hypothetical protein
MNMIQASTLRMVVDWITHRIVRHLKLYITFTQNYAYSSLSALRQKSR